MNAKVLLWALGEAGALIELGIAEEDIHVDVHGFSAGLSLHATGDGAARVLTQHFGRVPDSVRTCGEPGDIGCARWAKWVRDEDREVTLAYIPERVTRENWKAWLAGELAPVPA